MGMIQAPNQTPADRLDQMVQRYEKDLLRLCCIYLKDRTAAEDVVQETFLKAFRNMGSFRGESSEKTWLHDGLYLEDGTYLDIIGGDEMIQDDGSIIGWKECVIPADHLSDTLTFKAVLFRGKNTMFQDGNTLKWLYQRGDSTDVFFTLKRNDRYVFLKGSAGTAVYQARAELTSGSVDLKGSVRVIAPEKWVKIWTSWENEENLDVIESWNLYQNGVLISDEGMQSIRTEGAAEIIFELLYQHMESVEGLSLVPVFSQSGEHMNEAIRIERMIK